MILKNCSFEEFSNKVISANSRIVIFGTGVLCNVWFPYILKKYSLINRIDYCVDNDINKCNTYIRLDDKNIKIHSFQYLKDNIKKNQLILISVAAFREILEQLDNNSEFNDIIGYIAPIMFVENYRKKDTRQRLNIKQKIPKIIHYIWFSDNVEIPQLMKKCIESWRKYCPDYEIIRWDSTNYAVNKNKYMKQAYENKNWSFVSDFARLDILYKYGGIYFDTDVELIKNIDPLLKQEAFISFEKWPVINSGGGLGAYRGFPMLKELMEYKEKYTYIKENGKINSLSSGFYETIPFIEHGLKMNGQTQMVENMMVYSYDYFHPYDYMTGRCDISENTYSIHHFNRSWVNNFSYYVSNDTVTEYYKSIIERIERDI